MGFDPVTAFVVQLVVTTAISWVLKPDPPKRNVQQQETAQGILVNKASNNSAIPVVYGRRQVGIARVFVESSGSDNQYLYMAGVLCEGGGNGIESVDEIYVNDKLVVWSGALTDGTVRTVNSSDTNFYKGESLISIQAFFGLDNQSGSSLLDAEAVAMIHRADPLPPPPPEIEGETIELIVPIRFSLCKRSGGTGRC